LAASNAAAWPLVIAEVLPCHEIENVVPFEVMRKLKCAIGCTWNGLLPKIQTWEEANSVPLAERFWLFFDVKDGLSSEMIVAIDSRDIKWMHDRLLAADLSATPWRHTGYGHSVLSILGADNASLSELRRSVRHKNWLDVFSPLCKRLLWFFVAANPLKT
jgi:hypothetical protein